MDLVKGMILELRFICFSTEFQFLFGQGACIPDCVGLPVGSGANDFDQT